MTEPYDNPEVDPLDGQPCDFDWEGLYARVGEAQASLAEDRLEDLARALKGILEYLVNVDLKRPTATALIGRRALALAWTLSPAYFENSPSLSALAREIGVHKTVLSAHAVEARRRFGIRNRAQAHGWNFKPAADLETAA